MAQVLDAQPVEFLKSNGAAYLRVGFMSIALYDYVLTLPAEWRFYRSQTSWKLSPGCILFIVLRYLSIATITVSNVGYFSTFTWEECLKYYMVAPILKPAQMMVCQIILGLRAYNISRRAPWVLWTLLTLFSLLTAAEIFTNVFARIPIQNEHHNCVGANRRNRLSVWLFYLLAMFYDVFTMGISTYYLLDTIPSFRRMSGLVKLMFYDGIGYFVVLTAANIVNLILYRASDEEIQSSAATLGYVVTWIMAQRILIHLRDAAAQMRGQSVQTMTHTMTRELTSPRDISRIMRTQFSSQKRDRVDDDYALRPPAPSKVHDNSSSEPHSPNHLDVNLDVQVKIQHSVTVDYDPTAYDRETYRKSKRAYSSVSR